MIYDVSLAGPNTRGAKSREILGGREAAEQFPFPYTSGWMFRNFFYGNAPRQLTRINSKHRPRLGLLQA